MKTFGWLLTWPTGTNKSSHLKWLSRKTRRKRKCCSPPGSISGTTVPLAQWLLAVSVIVMAGSCTLVRSEALTHSDSEGNRANYDLNRTDLFNLNITTCSLSTCFTPNTNSTTSVNATSYVAVHHSVTLRADLSVRGPHSAIVASGHSISVPLPFSPSALTKHWSISANGSSSNRTHSVQLININQTDAVKHVRSAISASLVSASVDLAGNSVGPSPNRVNLTNNISTTQTTLDNINTNTSYPTTTNNVTNDFEKALPDFALHHDNYLAANLSSSATGGSISANWNCTNSDRVQAATLASACVTLPSAVADKLAADKLVPDSEDDKVSVGVSAPVESINWPQATASTRNCTADSSCTGLDIDINGTLNGTITKSSARSQFSHMQDNSLTVSAVIDPMAQHQPISALNAASASPSVSSSVLDDPLNTNYYRYSARDNDPNVLLSRYPSLRLPPPPPEFADEFNEGLTEIGTVSGDRVDIPCNTSTWAEDEVSLVLWFRGDTGVPIYRVDARSVPLAKSTHTTAEELRKRFFFDINVKPPVLRINPVLPSDAAEYRCRVDFRQSRTQNVLVALNVTVPPKELLIMDVEGQKLESVIGPYDENSNVLLICEAEGGKPSPSVNWYSGSRLLDSSFTTGPHGLVRNELNIRNLNRSDFMSILTCRASNNNVTEPISSTVILDMNLRPLDVKILTKSTPTTPSSASSSQIKSSSSSSAVTSIASPSTIILSGGSKAEFQCRTIGSRPAAQISWWLGSERLSSNVRDSVNEDGNATISSITFVPGVEDNGKMLTCRADNLPMPHTALKDERLLNVHFAPQLRISFGANIGRDNIREGSDVYLECRVRANPPVKEVVWLHDGRPLHGSLTGDVNAADASRSTIIMTNQSLVIQKVHRTHRGRYQCVAFNDQGETVSDPLHLKVNFAPVCTKAQKHQYGVSRNEQIRIRCEVDAEPSNGLTFRWTLNTSGSETSVEWASFTVNATTSIATYRPENSLDYGTLACVAQNSIGGQSEPCIYNVVPAGRPDPVRSCGITNHSMSTLLVECLPGDDGGLRQHFSLEVYIATTQRLHSNHSSSQPNFIVSSLTPGTQYSLVMYASNAKGRSHTVSLSAVTLSPPEKHIARGSIEQIVVHPFLAILIGSVATIVVIIILLVLIVRGRHARYRAQNHRNSNGRNGGSDSATALTSNGELKMKKIKMNGNATNNKGISNGKSKPSNGSDNNGKSSGPNVANMPNGECDAMRQLDSHYNNNNQKESPLRGGKEQGLTEKEMMANQAENVCYVGAIRHPNQDMASPIDHQREMNQMLLHSSQVMSDGSNLALISPSQLSVKCDTSLVLGSRPTSTGDGSQHSTSSSSATTAPISDLIGPNGSLYGPNESGLMHHSSCTVKPMSPSHQTITRTTQNGMPRHLVDLSSGSTCCSSSTSSSPHTLMQGPPPVPSLPQSITQGVMLFAPSELATVETVSSNSPSHFASHQYSTHQYHPYLNSHTSNTLPRHYDGNMSLSTASPLKLYSQDQIMHTSAIYEDQYTPVIVNSLEQAYPHHLTSVHQQATPILYYNSPSPIPSMVDASIDAKIHYHQHLKSSNTSQILPRRCSVGPLEGPQPNNDGLYVSFTKAPKNAAQAKNYSGSALLKTNQQAVHVDCVEGSGTMEPLLSANESNSSGSSTSANCDQANLSSSLRPHEICLTSSPRKGATAV